MSFGDILALIGLVLASYSAWLLAYDPLYRGGSAFRIKNLRTDLDNFRKTRKFAEDQLKKSLDSGAYTEARYRQEMAKVEEDYGPKEREKEKTLQEYPEKYESDVFRKAELGAKLLIVAFALQAFGLLLQAFEKKGPSETKVTIQVEQSKPMPTDVPICIGPFKPGEDSGAMPEAAVLAIANKLNEVIPDRHLLSLLVLGSADKQPLKKALLKKYGSDRGLAEARASWVKTRMKTLLKVQPTSYVILASGPTIESKTVSDREQDRFVEVYEVWGQADIQDTANPNKLLAAVKTSLPPNLTLGQACRSKTD
jgi:hypothetical protein